MVLFCPGACPCWLPWVVWSMRLHLLDHYWYQWHTTFPFSKDSYQSLSYQCRRVAEKVPPFQSGQFTSPRSTLQKSYAFCATLQCCYVFHTIFSLSPFSLFLECCIKYMPYVQQCTCNVVYFQCIWRNVIRPGRKIENCNIVQNTSDFCNVDIGEVNHPDCICPCLSTNEAKIALRVTYVSTPACLIIVWLWFVYS